jgi:hypothetical protein
VRRARRTTGPGVLCARYMCPRAVEAPGACARGSGEEKLGSVPADPLQRCAPGAWRRRGRQPRALHDARPRCEPDGGHSAPAPGAARPRGAPAGPPAKTGRREVNFARWPAERRGRGAGAAAQAPASSEGVLASFLLRQVGVCAGADRCGVLLLCVASQAFATLQMCNRGDNGGGICQ